MKAKKILFIKGEYKEVEDLIVCPYCKNDKDFERVKGALAINPVFYCKECGKIAG